MASVAYTNAQWAVTIEVRFTPPVEAVARIGNGLISTAVSGQSLAMTETAGYSAWERVNIRRNKARNLVARCLFRWLDKPLETADEYTFLAYKHMVSCTQCA
jgi:hypothetical protein